MPEHEPALTQAPPFGAAHGPFSALLACALGGPIAAGVLLARNERVFGRPERSRKWLIGTAAATLALFALGATLPDRFPQTALPAGAAAAVYQAAKILQGDELRRHLDGGGRRAGPLRALGVGLAFLALWAAILAAAFLFLDAAKSAPAV